MKAVNIALVAVALLALFAVGLLLFWIGLGFQPQPPLQAWAAGLEPALAAAGGLRAGLSVIGLLLACLSLLIVWGNIAVRRWERIIILRNPLGEVLVSLTALEDLGRVVRADVPGLRDIKLRVHASRRGLQVRARVTLSATEDLGLATEAVQAAIRKRLQQVLGAEQDIRPRVMVAKLLSRGESEADEVPEARPLRRLPPRP